MSGKQVRDFIERWELSGAAERANYQLFLSELCDVIEAPHPDPATPDSTDNAYVFERAVPFQDGSGKSSTRFIDLYKRGCFVLEAKQGADKPESGDPALSEVEKKLRSALKKGMATRGTKAWDEAMIRARAQADQYIRALPTDAGRPPLYARPHPRRRRPARHPRLPSPTAPPRRRPLRPSRLTHPIVPFCGRR